MVGQGMDDFEEYGNGCSRSDLPSEKVLVRIHRFAQHQSCTMFFDQQLIYKILFPFSSGKSFVLYIQKSELMCNGGF